MRHAALTGLAVVSAVALTVTVQGGHQDDPPPVAGLPPRGGLVAAGGLTGFGACDDLLDHLHREAQARVTPWGIDGLDMWHHGRRLLFLADAVAAGEHPPRALHVAGRMAP